MLELVCSCVAMATAQPNPKRARHDWSLADKIWLLDYARKNAHLGQIELGQVLARHLNEGRAADKIRIDHHPSRPSLIGRRKKNSFASCMRTLSQA